MNPLASEYIAHCHGRLPASPRDSHNHERVNSTNSAKRPVSWSHPCHATSSNSASSTFPVKHEAWPQRRKRSKMTTFYYYDNNGSVAASPFDPAVQPFTRGLSEYSSYEQRGDIVGAYLARHRIPYPAYTASEINYTPDNSSQNQGYWSSDGHESEGYAGSSCTDYASSVGYAGWASQSGISCPYPDPEKIRHLHTLHGLLPHLQPERKLNSLNGPTVDILEQDTGVVLAYEVPKKLLVLFLGRQLVNKFIRTISRENDDNWQGAPTCQELNLPRGHSSKAAMKVLIAWMIRACQYHTMGRVQQIRIPENTFVACSLAQTMELFGLHKDALRVDHEIANTHFVRPIFAQELETIWNCLGEESRYVYAAIKVVGRRLREFENSTRDNSSKSCEKLGRDSGKIVRNRFPQQEEMLAMLEIYPRLRARVCDLDLNEKHRPVFGTYWIRKLNSSTRTSKRSGSVASDAISSETTSQNLPQGARTDVSTADAAQKSPSADANNLGRRFSVIPIVTESPDSSTDIASGNMSEASAQDTQR